MEPRITHAIDVLRDFESKISTRLDKIEEELTICRDAIFDISVLRRQLIQQNCDHDWKDTTFVYSGPPKAVGHRCTKCNLDERIIG